MMQEATTLEGTAGTTSRAYLVWLLPLSVFLVGLALRLYCLDCHSLWNDEIESIETAQRGISAFFTDRFGWASNQTPLHYLIVWLTIQPTDPANTALFVRLPSALAGAASTLLVYGLGRELFGRSQGVLAALLVALSTPLIDYSQEARPYSMMLFLTLASVYCLVKADQTAAVRWWGAFALATTLNLLNSYMALTFFLSSLAPYLLWVTWRLWSRRKEERHSFLYAYLSFAVVALAAGVTLLDFGSAPRRPLDLNGVSPLAPVDMVVKLLIWFSTFGTGGALEILVQLAMLLLGLWGAYAGVRSGHGKGVSLCLLFIAIPSAMFALLSGSTTIFQRYALFVGPFYFLLVCNGLVAVIRAGYGEGARTFGRRLAGVSGMALAALVVALFVVGVYEYSTPNGPDSQTYRPDFRAASGYLTKHANPRDLIIFADDPALGYGVSSFYWHNKPPAPAYDARDPRLFAHKLDGDIYWVISSLDGQLVSRMADPNMGWLSVGRFDRVVVLREARPATGLVGAMAGIVAQLETISPGYQPLMTLGGCIAQAKGKTEEAAAAYRDAGTYLNFRFNVEYLRSAQDFAERGASDKAWRDALISKFMQPDSPESHLWLAQQLQREGYPTEADTESRIAQALQSARAAQK